MGIEKLKWALRLLRSRTYVLLTDKEAVVSIPLADIDSFENQFLLSAQTASLQEFRSRLEDLIGEHEQAIQLLAHRKGQKPLHKQGAQSSKNTRNKVRRPTQARKSK